jgi:hypothetical protein
MLNLTITSRPAIFHRLCLLIGLDFFSVLAGRTAASNQRAAKALGTASLGLSVAGIVVTVIILATVIGMGTSRASSGTAGSTTTLHPCVYHVKNLCFNNRRYICSSSVSISPSINRNCRCFPGETQDGTYCYFNS